MTRKKKLIVAAAAAAIILVLFLAFGAYMKHRLDAETRVMTPLPLVMIAAFATRYAYFAWSEAHAPAGIFKAYWMTQVLWSCVTAAVLWPTAAAFVYVFRPRRRIPGRCPKCNYDLTGIASDAVCPECGAAGGDRASPRGS